MNARRDLSTPLAAAILILATLLAFAPVLKLGFTNWDDDQTVSRNPYLNPVTQRSFVYFWTEPHMELYIPATYTLWAVTTQWARLPPPPPGAPVPESALDPKVFHGLNLALHLAAACAVMFLLREFVSSNLAAVAGAMIFALHPLQVETVAWVSGAKDLLFALLSLIALWQYVGYVKLRASTNGLIAPGERWRMLGIATGAFVVAMLAKPTAIVVPPIALAIDVLLLGLPWGKVFRTLWPWFVLMIPCIVWTNLVQHASQASGAAPALWLRPIVALDAIAFYLWKLIWPINLVIDYGRTPAAVVSSGLIRWTWIAPAALGTLFVILARRGVRVPLAAGAISVLALGPLLGLVPFAFQAYSTVADHYAYLPMIGPALAIAWAIDRGSRRVAAVLIVALSAIVLGVLSHRQVTVWLNTQTVFAHNLKIVPTSFAARSNLAADALDRHELEAAIDLSRQAIELNGRDVVPYHTLADALREKGDIAGARSAYQQAIQCEPNYAPALTNLAAILAAAGDFDQALPLFERSAALQPDAISPQLNLGKVYFQLDRPADARRQLDKVLQLDPKNPEARQLLSQLP